MIRECVSRALRRSGVRDCGILVAVSGGVDSCALLHALRSLAVAHGLTLRVGHVNHGLRGAASDADQAAVAELAAAWELPFLSQCAPPARLRVGTSSRSRPTLQEAARRLRHEALRRMAGDSGAAWVALGHNAGDQAETVMLRLLRGCGPDALGGMSECARDRGLLRPLLRVPRSEIESFARAEGLRWREDASNRSLRYARNRLRRRWFPGLAREFNPALVRAIGRLADAQRRDTEWLEALVEAEWVARVRPVPGGLGIDRSGWDSLPDALAWRLLRRAWVELAGGREVSNRHLERMLASLRDAREGSAIQLPEGLTLTCRRDEALLQARGGGVGSAC